MRAPVAATGNRETALPATAPTSRVAATDRTSRVAATDRTNRVAAIGPSNQAATGPSRPVPASTARLMRERCRSGSIRAG